MLFPVYSEEQIIEMRKPFEVGICDYAIQDANEGRSQNSGNEYIKLVVRVFDSNGTERTIYDYLIGTEKMAYKTRHFCFSCGLGSKYEAGKNFFPQDFIGKQGKAEVFLGKEKDQNGNTVERLKIKDYIPDNHVNNAEKELNDDIPF